MGLRECREAAGVTRIQAAYELHLSPAELDKLESSTKELTPRQVISLARLYHCQPEELGLGLDPDSLYGWRMYHGVSLAETARQIKVHWSKILDWENGLRTPSDAEIVRISGVTGIPIQSLMEAEGWWVDEREEETHGT